MQGRIKIDGPTLRRVMVYEMGYKKPEGPAPLGAQPRPKMALLEVGEGLFHTWTRTNEPQTGEEFAVAIVEMADGSVRTPRPEYVRFTDTKDLYYFKEHGDDPATAV